MQQPPKIVIKITKACLTLHNVLRRRIPLRPGEVDAEDDQGNIVPGAGVSMCNSLTTATCLATKTH